MCRAEQLGLYPQGQGHILSSSVKKLVQIATIMKQCVECNLNTLKGQMLKSQRFYVCSITFKPRKHLNGLSQIITITNKAKVTFNTTVQMSRLLEGFIITSWHNVLCISICDIVLFT